MVATVINHNIGTASLPSFVNIYLMGSIIYTLQIAAMLFKISFWMDFTGQVCYVQCKSRMFESECVYVVDYSSRILAIMDNLLASGWRPVGIAISTQNSFLHTSFTYISYYAILNLFTLLFRLVIISVVGKCLGNLLPPLTFFMKIPWTLQSVFFILYYKRNVWWNKMQCDWCTSIKVMWKLIL